MIASVEIRQIKIRLWNKVFHSRISVFELNSGNCHQVVRVCTLFIKRWWKSADFAKILILNLGFSEGGNPCLFCDCSLRKTARGQIVGFPTRNPPVEHGRYSQSPNWNSTSSLVFNLVLVIEIGAISCHTTKVMSRFQLFLKN